MFHADKKLVGLYYLASGVLGFLAALASLWAVLFLLLGVLLGSLIDELF